MALATTEPLTLEERQRANREAYPPHWHELVTCKLCGHESHAQFKRTGYKDGTWLCLSRRACRRRQLRRGRS